LCSKGKTLERLKSIVLISSPDYDLKDQSGGEQNQIEKFKPFHRHHLLSNGRTDSRCGHPRGEQAEITKLIIIKFKFF
jgi:hypothetical protein